MPAVNVGSNFLAFTLFIRWKGIIQEFSTCYLFSHLSTGDQLQLELDDLLFLHSGVSVKSTVISVNTGYLVQCN